MMGEGTEGDLPAPARRVFELLSALALFAESRDRYSKGHSERVAFLARELASELGLPRESRLEIEMAARVHDIGKLYIREEVLLKPGPLSPEEWLEIKQHPSKGAELLTSIEFFHRVVPIIESHHEYFDGSGYPRGLKGDQIPLGARILAVADAYDALTSERSYRPSFSQLDALSILSTGGRWDPRLVEAFIGMAKRIGNTL